MSANHLIFALVQIKRGQDLFGVGKFGYLSLPRIGEIIHVNAVVPSIDMTEKYYVLRVVDVDHFSHDENETELLNPPLITCEVTT